MKEQAYDRLSKMKAYGQSKQQAKIDGTADQKIFSIGTFNSYMKQINLYVEWLEKTHPECKTFKKGKKFVKEYLEARENQTPELSAYTIHLDAKALGKVYQISPEDKDYYKPKERRRVDIKRSRGEAVRDKHFSERNNWELVCFCRGTGLRRSELTNLYGTDCKTREELKERLTTLENNKNKTAKESKELGAIKDILEQFPEEEHFVWVASGKGGRPRYAPIIGEHKQAIIERIKNTPSDRKVWEYVSTNADIHSYRAEYATKIYKTYARDIKDIPYDKINKGTGKKYQGDVYFCRSDEKGKKLDKKAMLKASKALGHNRLCVVSDHYVRGL